MSSRWLSAQHHKDPVAAAERAARCAPQMPVAAAAAATGADTAVLLARLASSRRAGVCADLVATAVAASPAAAAHRACSPAALRALENTDPYPLSAVRHAAASTAAWATRTNPDQAPSHLIDWIAHAADEPDTEPESDISAPAPRALLARLCAPERTFSHTGVASQAKAASTVRCPPAMIVALVVDAAINEIGDDIAMNAAGSPHCAPAAQAALVVSDSPMVCMLAAGNLGCHPAILTTFAASDADVVRIAVAGHPNTAAAALRILASSPDKMTRGAVANRGDCPAALLDQLALDPCPEVSERANDTLSRNAPGFVPARMPCS